MYIIAGLGNPGKEYEKTRHNMGFLVLDQIAADSGIRVNRLKHRALTGEGRIAGQKVMLVKPQTYMNNSGESLGEIVRYYHAEPENVIVIYDDLDLETGAVRIRKKGGPGTHNGMKSVISHLQRADFPRIRVGIGHTGSDEWKDFVLGQVGRGDADLLASAVQNAADAAVCIIRDGIDMAMNRYNTKKKKAEKGSREDPGTGSEQI